MMFGLSSRCLREQSTDVPVFCGLEGVGKELVSAVAFAVDDGYLFKRGEPFGYGSATEARTCGDLGLSLANNSFLVGAERELYQDEFLGGGDEAIRLQNKLYMLECHTDTEFTHRVRQCQRIVHRGYDPHTAVYTRLDEKASRARSPKGDYRGLASKGPDPDGTDGRNWT